MHSSAILLFSLVAFALFGSNFALNCYSCSHGTDGCGISSFNKNGAGVLQASDSSYTYCSKTIYSSNGNSADRSAASSCTEGSYTSSGVTYTTYCCTSDLCNHAEIKTSNIILGIGTVILTLFLVK